MQIMKLNLAERVTEWLLDAIKDGHYKEGDQLPSVEQLAQDLDVGRSSVREALRFLQARGIVSIIHGKGTFVNATRMVPISSFFGFTDYMKKLGLEPMSVILRRELVDPDETVKERLCIEEGEKVNYVYRLRLANGEPMAIESSYTPYHLFPDLLNFPWTVQTSLYQLFREKYGLILHYARQGIMAVSITESQSQLLQIPAGSPGLLVREIVYTNADIPIEFTRILYRGDRYEYNLTLPGDQVDGQAYLQELPTRQLRLSSEVR